MKFLPGEANPKWRPAIERFVSKCAFDPITGCVMWIGGQTSGRGHNEPYGSFWFDGRRWFAHRWAAQFIHGFSIDGLQVDHWCPCGPSTLCIEHVKPETPSNNRELQNVRPGRSFQTLATKQWWLLVTKGIEEEPPRERDNEGIPFHTPPEWLRPYLVRENSDACPF